MKKILVACGAGVVTSTVAMNKLKEAFDAHNVPEDAYQIDQTSIAQVASMADNYDLVVTTTQYDGAEGTTVLNGLPFLTNIGVDPLIDKAFEVLGFQE